MAIVKDLIGNLHEMLNNLDGESNIKKGLLLYKDDVESTTLSSSISGAIESYCRFVPLSMGVKYINIDSIPPVREIEEFGDIDFVIFTTNIDEGLPTPLFHIISRSRYYNKNMALFSAVDGDLRTLETELDRTVINKELSSDPSVSKDFRMIQTGFPDIDGLGGIPEGRTSTLIIDDDIFNSYVDLKNMVECRTGTTVKVSMVKSYKDYNILNLDSKCITHVVLMTKSFYAQHRCNTLIYISDVIYRLTPEVSIVKKSIYEVANRVIRNPIGLKSEDSGMTLDEVEARSIKLIKDLLKTCKGNTPVILDISYNSEGMSNEMRITVCDSMKTVLTGRQSFAFRTLEAKHQTYGGVPYSDIDCVMLTCPVSALSIDVIKTIISMIKRNGKLHIVSMVESNITSIMRFLRIVTLDSEVCKAINEMGEDEDVISLDEVRSRVDGIMEDLSRLNRPFTLVDVIDYSKGIDSTAELRRTICDSIQSNTVTKKLVCHYRSLDAKNAELNDKTNMYSDIDCLILQCRVSEISINTLSVIITIIRENPRLRITSMVESEVRDFTRFLARVPLEAMGGYEDTLELDDETDDIIEKKSEPVMTLSDFDEDYSLTVTFAGDVELRCDWSELSENIGYIKFLSDYAYYCLAEAGEPMHPIQMYASGIEDLSELFDRAVYYADRIRCVNRDDFEGNTEVQTIVIVSQLMMPILSDMCYSHKYETRPFICRYKIRELVSESEIYKNLRLSCKDNNTFNCTTMGSLIGGDLALFASNLGHYRWSMNMYDIDKLEDIKESFL